MADAVGSGFCDLAPGVSLAAKTRVTGAAIPLRIDVGALGIITIGIVALPEITLPAIGAYFLTPAGYLAGLGAFAALSGLVGCSLF